MALFLQLLSLYPGDEWPDGVEPDDILHVQADVSEVGPVLDLWYLTTTVDDGT